MGFSWKMQNVGNSSNELVAFDPRYKFPNTFVPLNYPSRAIVISAEANRKYILT